MAEKIEVSKYDNSFSVFYKYADRFQTPVRFLLAKPKQGLHTMSEEFNLDENLDAVFTTIFDYVRKQVEQGQTLSQIWANTNVFQGELINPVEFIYIYYHSIGNIDMRELEDFVKVSKASLPFSKLEDLTSYYEKSWYPRFEKELQKDLAVNEKYLENQRKLTEIKSLLTSPLMVSRIVFSFQQEIQYDPLPDLFDQMSTSTIIPFIQYNKGSVFTDKNSQRIYKIYKGDPNLDYNRVKLETGQTPNRNTIYFNIWSGEDNESPKETYTIGQISYQNNLVEVQLETSITEEHTEMTLIDRFFEHLPTNIIKKPSRNDLIEKDVTGSFYIYSTKLEDDVFHWFNLNNELFVNYMYIQEETRTIVARKNIQIFYRGTVIKSVIEDNIRKTTTRSPVSATISEEMIIKGSKINILAKGKVVKMTIKKPDYVLKVDMNRASSRHIATQFMDILSKLMRIYNQEKQQVMQNMFMFVPDYKTYLQEQDKQQPPVYSSEPILPPSITEDGQYLRSKTQLLSKKLAMYAKDVFVNKYVRVCQGNRQPDIISEHEVELWEKYYDREPLYYPPENPKYIFICPDDKYPNPGLVTNNLKNSDIYPSLPCCYPSRDTKQRSGGTGLVNPISTFKVLSPTGRGYLSSDLSEFLSLYTITLTDDYGEDYEVELDEDDSYYRYGVIRDPNSFIHCLLDATDDSGYNDLDTDEERIEYAHKLRLKLFSADTKPRVRYAACKQELYDYSDEKIEELVNDPMAFFNPLMFYRALEEYFKVNIYIFNIEGKDRVTKNRINLLQIPRHKLFHVHPDNNRPVVMIISHMGAESNYLEYPQCELIVFKNGDEYIKVFNKDLNKLIKPAIDYMSRTITWQPVSKTIQVRENYFSSLNLKKSLGQIPITNQLLDENGKARYLVIAPEWGNSKHDRLSNLRIFIATPPTAPLNVSEIKKEDIHKHLPPYEKVLELFGTPSLATLDLSAAYYNGFWFKVGDNETGIYCPFQQVSRKAFVEKHRELAKIKTQSEASNLNISVHQEAQLLNPLHRMKMLRKASTLVYQFYQYLYLVDGSPTDVYEFVKSISKVLNTTLDSAKIYRLENFPRVFPSGDSAEEVIASIEKYNIPFIKNGRILLYNKNMVDGIVSNLRKFAKDVEDIPVTAKQYAESRIYYQNASDFRKNEDEILLLSITEYNNWVAENVKSVDLQTRETQHLKDYIQTRLNPIFSIYTEPFIYQQISDQLLGSNIEVKKDRYYMIQNVASGELLRAINVALTWMRELKNLGFRASPYEDNINLPAHKIYSVTSFGNVKLEQDNSTGSKDFLRILHYGKNSFAAMLPLLTTD